MPSRTKCRATIGLLDALRCGTTTLIDHHASPRAIAGSLDAIEQGIATVGLRGILYMMKPPTVPRKIWISDAED